jgi:predicted RNA-binding Zn-ribbon protein involved in translation (DUF1610 family)
LKITQRLAEGKMKQPFLCELDLTRIQGDGDFPCPNCGVIISPEDETENVYRLLETKVRGETLEELVIQCNKCASQLRLIGFLSLERENL